MEDMYYRLKGALDHWGDYGNILFSGMTTRREEGDPLPLERTGPFVPPISSSWTSVIVTDDFRKKLESSGLTGFTFGPVIKKKIVRLEWEKWDLTAEEPERYPAGGEPENYIYGRKHQPKLADEMGDLWEMFLVSGGKAESVKTGTMTWKQWEVPVYEVHLEVEDEVEEDFFKAGIYTYVSERAKDWLEREIPKWVTLEPAIMK